ncbi:tetratricopeptide repeat protein [Aureispira anguillae]|uniref:Tetratricopeptide repeat protein n=1 Tax=Aureispira anguillae TaxID=2864201 RepID=A0A916DU12_9BACT|nr:tetratricopeptide repeat protein [Aureispira anguillae]BDS13734.1 tetratricopeptide repeat protein [Aureispira anguillae]
MRKLYISLLLSAMFVGFANAQKTLPWKKRLKMAQNFEKAGDYYQAAVYYEGIYAEKSDKPEYSYQAGVCYYLLRDYANTVKTLEPVKDQNDIYDKPGYKYAVALKQTGQAAKAKSAFDQFIKSYPSTKDDYKEFKEACENEIKGCDFALNKKKHTNDAVKIELLDAKINTNKTEFAPIPFDENILYFSSSTTGAAKVYRSQKNGDNWSRPQVPKIFEGKMARPHFGNGTFTEDNERFYFTQCDLPNGKPNCAIYVMSKISAEEWSDPVMLPDYINEDGANTTHPCVVTTDDKEILYFVSDREGGRGGLDIWFTTRTVGSSSNNFTLPKNLGRNINTFGDEITPNYDKAEGVLYFSSNGRVSAGGLDIFKSKGEKLQWEIAQNLGFPLNSAADDLYYTVSEAHGGGYFVSNRLLAPKKTATTDDDIFYFGENKIIVTISGAITDANYPDNGPLTDVNIKLFNEDELVEERMLSIAEYRFKLGPKKQYTIEIYKEDYNLASFDVNTSNFEYSEDVVKDVALEIPKEDPIPTVPDDPEEVDWDAVKAQIVPPEYDSRDNPYSFPEEPFDPLTGEEYVGPYLEVYNEIKNDVANLSNESKVYYDGPDGELLPYMGDVFDDVVEEPIVDTPIEKIYPDDELAPEGTVYKIQVSAVRRFKSYKYDALGEVGKLAFEDIDDGIRRVMVVPEELTDDGLEGFKSKGDALNTLSYVINNTRFENAFVIKVVNGERVGEGFRGWDEEENSSSDSESTENNVNEDYEGF